MGPETLKLTPYETVEIVSRSKDSLEVVATYVGKRGRPPRHWHPSQDEHFEVLSGTVQAEFNGRTRELQVGDSIEISRRSSHRLWNDDAQPARVAWRTSPAGRTEQWFRAIDALHREGRVRKSGMPSVLAFAVLLSEYRDVLRLTAPDAVLRPTLAMLAVAGRARGYSARSTQA